MSISQLFTDTRLTYKTATYYSRNVPDTRITSKMLNPNGQEYSFNKMPVHFRCAVYENKRTYGIPLLDGISVADGTLVLISPDNRAMNIKRGDRVVFENESFMVTDFNLLTNRNRNSQFQKITNNQIAVITVT